jgi:hypothetical protein
MVGGGTDALSQYLANQKKQSEKVPDISRESIQWTADVPGARSELTEHVFETAGAKQLSLGSVKAVSGRKYILSASVLKPNPDAKEMDTRFEVHRSMAGWSKGFPRMLVAGAIGVLAGMAGMMLIAYGALQAYNLRHVSSERPKDLPS